MYNYFRFSTKLIFVLLLACKLKLYYVESLIVCVTLTIKLIKMCFFFFILENIWEQDLGDTFKIDASTEGLQKVHLKCGSDSMFVQLETAADFTGVMYTRGSFYKQKEPCFTKPAEGKRSRSLTMKFSLDQCQTVQVRTSVFFFHKLLVTSVK